MHTYARLCSTFDGNFWSQLPRWFVSRQWAGSILRVDVCSHLIKIWFWTAYLQHFEVQFTAVIASSVRQANKHINSSTIVGIRNWFNVAKKKKKRAKETFPDSNNSNGIDFHINTTYMTWCHFLSRDSQLMEWASKSAGDF